MARKIKGRTRILFILVALVAAYGILNATGVIQGIKFRKSTTVSSQTALPSGVTSSSRGAVLPYQAPGMRPLRTNKQPIVVEMMTWQSQFAVPFANGGKLTTEGSLVAKHGSYVQIVRQEDCFQMRLDLARAGQVISQNGEPEIDGVCIMGDYTATFLTPLNEQLAKYGQHASVYYSFGRSLGEDKVMVTPDIAADPKKLLGATIAGVAGDGDINLLLNLADANSSWLKVNPELGTWDPDAVNIYNVKTYEDAAKVYIAGGKVQLKNKRNGKVEWHTINGFATWTPQDDNAVRMRGGVVTLCSTADYANQMPCAMIMIDSWERQHHNEVVGFCAATSEAADMIINYPQAFQKAGELFALVFDNQNADYWCSLFHGKMVSDNQGNNVKVGGSMMHNAQDNALLFGLKGGTDVFEITYRRHGQLVADLWPDMLAKFPDGSTVINTSVVQAVLNQTSSAPAQVPDFSQPSTTHEVVSRSDWKIEFASGQDQLTPYAVRELQKMADQMITQSNLRLELHAHTDKVGGDQFNMDLSQRRGEAVQMWLQNYNSTFFGPGRITVIPHGMREPLMLGDTPAAYAANRRVELVTYR